MSIHFKNPALLISQNSNSATPPVGTVRLDLTWKLSQKMKDSGILKPRNPLSAFIPLIPVPSTLILRTAISDFYLSLIRERALEAINSLPSTTDSLSLPEDIFTPESLSVWYSARKENSARLSGESIELWFKSTIVPAALSQTPPASPAVLNSYLLAFQSLARPSVSLKPSDLKKLLAVLEKFSDAVCDHELTLKVASKLDELSKPKERALELLEEL